MIGGRHVHWEHDTGGWVGPLNLILAQKNPSDALDTYTARYVRTPSTRFLRMPPNCSLVHARDFDMDLGQTSVRQTVQTQATTSDETMDHYYEPYLNTCDNGNVKPLLPRLEFEFQKEANGIEKLRVNLDYNVMILPHQNDTAYNLMPALQERFNSSILSGPFCHGDDPSGSYALGFQYNSTEKIINATAKSTMTLRHRCEQGLPCLPPAASADARGRNNNPHHPQEPTLDVGRALLTFCAYFLMVALLSSLTCNCQLATRLRRLQQETHDDDDDDDDDPLRRPLLQQEQPDFEPPEAPIDIPAEPSQEEVATADLAEEAPETPPPLTQRASRVASV